MPKLSWSFQPSNDTLQAADEILPAVICALISCLLIGTEAEVLHANVGAALRGVNVQSTTESSPNFSDI